MSKDLMYKFDIATNQTDERIRVLGVEFYARAMDLSQQLRVNKMRSNYRRQQESAEGQAKTVLELEMEVFAEVLKTKVVNPADKKKVTASWLGKLTQDEYYRLFNFMLTGEDLAETKEPTEPAAGGSDTPNT